MWILHAREALLLLPELYGGMEVLGDGASLPSGLS